MANQQTSYIESNALLAIQTAQMDDEDDYEAEAREILADMNPTELYQLAAAAGALRVLCQEMATEKRSNGSR